MVNYLIFLILTSGGTMQNIKYPETEIVNVVDTLFGITIPDPYRWLENFNDPEVKKWVEAQNALTRSILDSLPERKKLEAELEKILTKVSLSSPFVRGNKYFFYRRTGRENHAILYMSEGKFDPNNARVIIDPNKFSKDGTVAMDWLYPSLDGRYIAYGKSKSGSENSTLYILDVETRKHLKDTIPDTKWTSLAWLPDNSGFYYARNTGGDKFLPRIYFHKLGTPWEEDEYIYGEELGPTEIPAIKVSRDGKYLFLSISRGWTQNDLYFRRIGVDKDWKPIAVGLDGTFRVKVYRDTLYILTNYKAPRYRLLKMAVNNPDIEKADEIIP
ncbi:MAG TPA: S9 family peptidase, partial [candidate division WOR-3 bacterium]|nr:S9 family peptidase [candidate division WOR-3 bacterium]